MVTWNDLVNTKCCKSFRVMPAKLQGCHNVNLRMLPQHLRCRISEHHNSEKKGGEGGMFHALH